MTERGGELPPKEQLPDAEIIDLKSQLLEPADLIPRLATWGALKMHEDVEHDPMTYVARVAFNAANASKALYASCTLPEAEWPDSMISTVAARALLRDFLINGSQLLRTEERPTNG